MPWTKLKKRTGLAVLEGPRTRSASALQICFGLTLAAARSNSASEKKIRLRAGPQPRNLEPGPQQPLSRRLLLMTLKNRLNKIERGIHWIGFVSLAARGLMAS